MSQPTTEPARNRIVSELDRIAIMNLTILSKHRRDESFRWYADGAELKLKLALCEDEDEDESDESDESYDTGDLVGSPGEVEVEESNESKESKESKETNEDRGNTFRSLEYPCLLMFTQSFRFLDDPNRLRFGQWTRREVLMYIESALESLCHLLHTVSGESDEDKLDRDRLLCMIWDSEDRHSVHEEFYTRSTHCTHCTHYTHCTIYERVILWVSETFDALVDTMSQSNWYLYTTPIKTCDSDDYDDSSCSDNEGQRSPDPSPQSQEDDNDDDNEDDNDDDGSDKKVR
jgi:hypothetical protein